MTARRNGNPGRREREARKRHWRARITGTGAEATTLKLGSKHLSRYYRRRNALTVAECEKLATGAQESSLQHQQPG